MITQRIKLAAAAGALLLTLSCAKPPAQEMADAENAMNAAVQAGAEQYSTNELTAAQETLADARAKMESKDYKGAKMAALDAKSKAEAAQAAVEPNKQAAMTAVQERMDAMKPAVEAAQAGALKLKGKAAEALKTDAAALMDGWNSLQADFDGGNYVTAQGKLDEAQVKLDALKTALEEAKTAPKKK